jgi:DNA-binding response OmpR family regulator
MLVDDEPTLVDILAEFLQGDGHIIETATCGNAAWKKCEHAAFDVVVLDRSMPDMTGDELAVSIKKTSPRTRVIMLTGFGEIMKACCEKPAGVDLILCKPITIEEIRNAIAAVMSQSPLSVE